MFTQADVDAMENGKRWKWRAYMQVWRAVKKGLLPKLDGQVCADCSAPAVAYDHRDYGKPLDVVPVCHSCNLLRGPGMLREPPKQIQPQKEGGRVFKTESSKLAQAAGRKGGPARAAALTPERRSEIARMGALARHGRGLDVKREG